MPPLRDTRQEKFCQLLASGMSQTQAYIKAGYSENEARTNAAQLRAKQSISTRMDELTSETSKACEMSRAEYATWLKAAMEDDSMTGPQLKAAELLGKVLQHFAPDRVEHQVQSDTLTDFLKKLRSK